VVCFQEAGILREFGNPVKEYLGTTARPMMRNNSMEFVTIPHRQFTGG
jgi:hypothetical protein